MVIVEELGMTDAAIFPSLRFNSTPFCSVLFCSSMQFKRVPTSLLSGFPGSAGILCSTSRVSTAITPTFIPPNFALPVTTLLPHPPG